MNDEQRAAIRAQLAKMADVQLLEEWDRVSELEPPNFEVEGLISEEMDRRVGEPETSSYVRLTVCVDDRALAHQHAQEVRTLKAENDALRARVEALEDVLRAITTFIEDDVQSSEFAGMLDEADCLLSESEATE